MIDSKAAKPASLDPQRGANWGGCISEIGVMIFERCTKVHLLDTGRDKDAVFWRVVRSLGALLCTFWTLRLMAARGFGVPISHQVPFYDTCPI